MNAPGDGIPTPAERLRFLRSPAAHEGHAGRHARVQTIETHMSWVFVAGSRVVKLKKAVRYPYLDFSTLQAREFYCREELRLNARLAPTVYLGLLALRWDGRALAVTPEDALPAHGQTLDWMVLMRRLPRTRMLDVRIAGGVVSRSEIDSLAAVLIRFYGVVPAWRVPGDEYLAHFEQQQAVNRDVLLRRSFDLVDAKPTLERLDRALRRHAPALRERAERGCIVDGHGDLRPEHVCLLPTPVVIDALEFNAQLRRCDPLDELAALGMECEIAGAGWIGPRLLELCLPQLDHGAQGVLWPLYRAYRALLRARLAVAHLLEPEPRRPSHWIPLAQRCVDLAAQALQTLETAASRGASGSGCR